MTLTSAFEDLQLTTLQAVTGSLRRLEYFAKLRDPGGAYGHWGLARVHGELAAEKALIQAHHDVLSQILSTPIRQLLRDVEESSEVLGLSPTGYLEQLRSSDGPLLPPKVGAGSARHLSSVL